MVTEASQCKQVAAVGGSSGGGKETESRDTVSPRISCVGAGLREPRVECLAAAGGRGETAEQPRNPERPAPCPALPTRQAWLVPVGSASPSSLQEIPLSAARGAQRSRGCRVCPSVSGFGGEAGPCCLSEAERPGPGGGSKTRPSRTSLYPPVQPCLTETERLGISSGF